MDESYQQRELRESEGEGVHEGVEEGERGDCLVRGAATIDVGVTAAHALRYCQALRSSLGRGFVLCKGNVRAV